MAGYDREYFKVRTLDMEQHDLKERSKEISKMHGSNTCSTETKQEGKSILQIEIANYVLTDPNDNNIHYNVIEEEVEEFKNIDGKSVSDLKANESLVLITTKTSTVRRFSEEEEEKK